MTHNFLEYNQDQQHLLPKDLSEWVEEDSLERFVSDTIDYLDAEGRLDPFYPEPREDGRGRPSYHPVMLLKVFVFGYSIGVRSSRKLDRLLERDVAFRYLAANQQPDFRTISDFRKDHREEFEYLFEEILRLCREAGLADLGEVALDGQRVQGDAALEANRTRDQLQEEIQNILDEAKKIDAEEDEEYGPENRGDELPEELREQEDRLERLLDKAQRFVDLDEVLLDRGFYSNAVYAAIHDRGITYTSPVPKYEDDYSIIEDIEEHPTAEAAVNHNVPFGYGGEVHHTAEFLYVPTESDDADGKYAVFVTNRDRVEPEEIEQVCNRYRRRWDIENQYKSIKSFLPKTSSMDYRIRFVKFALAALIYNLWRLTDYLTKAAIGEGIRSPPVITAKTFVRALGDFLRDIG